MRKKIFVEGMTCKHCVMHVTNALKEIPGVSGADVSLESKTAIVEGTGFDDAKLKAAVEDSGYSVASILDIP